MNNCYPFTNTPLPYDYSALEPYIDQKTMQIHHDRHLQTYIDNLNSILESNPSLKRFSLEELLISWCNLCKSLQTPIRNNAGGVYNHRFFFDGMGNFEQKTPVGNLAKAIDKQFGSFDNFKSELKKEALSVFGSGYAWLVYNKGMLKIISTANQNTPNLQRCFPILNIDVWEHAYYLKHYNMRSAYVDDWFFVIDWKKAEERYIKAVNCFSCK